MSPITATELRQRLLKSTDEHCELTVDDLKKVLADYNLEEQKLIAITQLLNNALRDNKPLISAKKGFIDYPSVSEIVSIINASGTVANISLSNTKKFPGSDSPLSLGMILNVRKIKPLAQRIER